MSIAYIAPLSQHELLMAESFASEWEVAFRHNASYMLAVHGLEKDDLGRIFQLPGVGGCQVIGWKQRNRKYPLILLDSSGNMRKVDPGRIPFVKERLNSIKAAKSKEEVQIDELFQSEAQRQQSRRAIEEVHQERQELLNQAAWS